MSDAPADALCDLPPRLLVTGPPGSGKSRLALAAFDHALDQSGPDRALLVLPTYGEVEHHKRLAISRREDRRDARAILDVSYATFTSLGERLVPGFRVRALPSRRERDLLAEEALQRAAVPAFEAVRDRPGFRSRFLRLVKEMKQTGEDPVGLRSRARAALGALSSAAAERLAGFLDAWAAYDALLGAAMAHDHEDVLRDLVARARAGTPGLEGLSVLVVDGFEDLTGVEAALLHAATDAVVAGGGRVLVTLPWDGARPALFCATLPLRDRLLARGFVHRHLPAFLRSEAAALRRLASDLFAQGPPGGATPPPCPPGDALRSIVGSDDADEIDRIGREILRVRREEPEVAPAFRHFGVILRRLDARGSAARAGLEALGIPTRTVGGGGRLCAEPLVRALRGPLSLLAGDDGHDDRDFDAGRLWDHVRWRALFGRDPVPVADVDAMDVVWRREGFPSDWARFVAAVDRTASEPTRALLASFERRRARAGEVEGASAVAALLEEAIVEWTPLPDAAPLDADGRPTDPEGDARLRRAVAARERLVGLVREGARAAVRTGLGADTTVAAAVADLLAATEEAVSEPPDRRLDTVHLLDAEEARHWDLPVVFVAGLSEGAFPLRPSQDVFLRDEDREALERAGVGGGGEAGAGWRTARGAEAGERRLFLSAVTRARRRLYLTRALADDDGHERTPSFFWRDVRRALGLGESDGHDFGRPQGDLARLAVAPAAAELARDLLVFAADRMGAAGGADARVEADRPLAVALLRARPARAADLLRRAARFRRPEADPLDPALAARFREVARALSPTQLTAGRACLHRFFLSYVAPVGADDASFRGPGLDAPVFGRLVHRALERAVREPEATPEDLAASVLEERERGLSDPAERADALAELARIVRLFRDREGAAAKAGFLPAPRDLEVAFGAEGLEVALGDGEGRFSLKGRFDRLDLSPPGGPRLAVVVDYKTGATGTKDSAKAMRDLVDLQLPLYARAIESLRGVRVVALEHYAATRRERQVFGDAEHEPAWRRRAEREKPVLVSASEFAILLRKAEALASGVVSAVRRGGDGGHRKAPLDRTHCSRCAVRAVCRPDVQRFPSGRADEEDDE